MHRGRDAQGHDAQGHDAQGHDEEGPGAQGHDVRDMMHKGRGGREHGDTNMNTHGMPAMRASMHLPKAALPVCDAVAPCLRCSPSAAHARPVSPCLPCCSPFPETWRQGVFLWAVALLPRRSGTVPKSSIADAFRLSRPTVPLSPPDRATVPFRFLPSGYLSGTQCDSRKRITHELVVG
jgi:hypothetical protein